MTLTKRQTEIIDAALILTATGGIQNLTIKNIGNTLGITEPAIYRHFKNKSVIVKTMIEAFDCVVPTEVPELRGFDAIAAFVRSRLRQVTAKPALARVMFAEELFMGDAECAKLLFTMMHRHKDSLQQYFLEAQEKGELRRDIALDILFRMVLGPVRLLVKQWGMSEGSFDLAAKGDELLEALRKTLK